MASKLCDACKSATATLFCKADTAYLCVTCDSKVHAANKLASRHARVWVCEVCESAPAHVTCKADAAALCVTCDRDIHSANPLARRHLRLPVTPFFDSPSATETDHHQRFSSDADVSAEEGWLLPNSHNATCMNMNNSKAVMGLVMMESEDSDFNAAQYVLPDTDPFLDLDFYANLDPKQEAADDHEQNSSGTDCVVPVQDNKNVYVPNNNTIIAAAAAAAGGGLVNENCYDLDFTTGSKSFAPTYNGYSLSHSVSSSSLDVGVVPDGSAMTDITNPFGRASMGPDQGTNQTVVQLSGVDREARVLRYREKRKNRKFEKTIRYASRKAYAETRPRIKGRFAKRTDLDVAVVDSTGSLFGFSVVPSF